MRLDGLKDFHNSMKINDVKRSKFIFTYSNVVFDVFFFTDEVPYKLCIGVIARNFYFELNSSDALVIIPHSWIEWMAPSKIIWEKKDG